MVNELKKRGMKVSIPAILERMNYKNFKMDSTKNVNKLLLSLKCTKTSDDFYYEINTRVWNAGTEKIIDNFAIDYKLILNNSIEDLYWDNELKEALISLCHKISKSNEANNFVYNSFENLINGKAKSFKDALQRILFINQLQWQTKHKLVGLGRLDFILKDLYESDIKNEIISKKEAKDIIRSFLKTLHKFYEYKSSELIGDTGQIIILGGLNPDGTYFNNDLTRMFIEEMKIIQLPDPKVLLRVSQNMPSDLWDVSIDCISTGIGCPLFANDDVIIPSLLDAGYKKEDVFNYGTSACWEPLIIGKSCDQNNIGDFVLPDAINKVVEENDFSTFDEMLDLLKVEIKNRFIKKMDELDKIHFSDDPIQSSFFEGCRENKSHNLMKYAQYRYFGILSSGFTNGINSLLAIKKNVYDDKRLTLKEFNEIRKNNFINDSKVDMSYEKLGNDTKDVINLVNKIIKYMQEASKDLTNKHGYKCKFGLSSPGYVTIGKKCKASFDGRTDYQAFSTHLSAVGSIPYTELLNCISSFDYTKGCVNGNVVDFMVTPNIILDNTNKFIDLLKVSQKKGFFEMQMNVVSSKVLIDAKAHPENYKGLIVRVWGFSAYFNDLPEEYKDILIKRALDNESSYQ